MKRIALLLVIAVSLLTGSARAQDAEDTSERVMIAQRIVERIWGDSRRTIEVMRDQIAQTLPLEQREAFREMLNEYFDYETYRKLNIAMMVRHFTLAELTALDGFYASPEGQSVMQKMPLMTTEMMSFAQRLILEAIRRAPRDKRPPQLRDF